MTCDRIVVSMKSLLVDAQRAEGYRVVGSFVDDLVVAAVGFRLSTNLALGRAISSTTW